MYGRRADAVPAPVMLITAIVSFQVGAALATHMFDAAGVEGAVFLRCALGALLLMAITRPTAARPLASRSAAAGAAGSTAGDDEQRLLPGRRSAAAGNRRDGRVPRPAGGRCGGLAAPAGRAVGGDGRQRGRAVRRSPVRQLGDRRRPRRSRWWRRAPGPATSLPPSAWGLAGRDSRGLRSAWQWRRFCSHRSAEPTASRRCPMGRSSRSRWRGGVLDRVSLHPRTRSPATHAGPRVRRAREPRAGGGRGGRVDRTGPDAERWEALAAVLVVTASIGAARSSSVTPEIAPN